jgi:Zn-dependent alcohol dehydrogenase
MNVNIGHGHIKVKSAVVQQMDQLSYVYPGMATEARGRLGKKLSEITPEGLNKTFFTLGGAEAVENAIKLARAITGRAKIVSLYRPMSPLYCWKARMDPRAVSNTRRTIGSLFAKFVTDTASC